jgi:cell division topological specificity factor
MRELLRWLLGLADKGSESSSDVARQRMRLVLIQDRIDLSPDKMDQMKQEIWEVVSRYMVVDDDFMEFEVRRLDELIMFVSHIEVKDLNALVSARSA